MMKCLQYNRLMQAIRQDVDMSLQFRFRMSIFFFPFSAHTTYVRILPAQSRAMSHLLKPTSVVLTYLLSGTRVCEKMSCRQSKIIVYICRYLPQILNHMLLTVKLRAWDVLMQDLEIGRLTLPNSFLKVFFSVYENKVLQPMSGGVHNTKFIL